MAKMYPKMYYGDKIIDAADANLIAAVRQEARNHMRAMMKGKSFLQFQLKGTLQVLN